MPLTWSEKVWEPTLERSNKHSCTKSSLTRPFNGVERPQAVSSKSPRLVSIEVDELSVDSELLDMNGILFGIQLVVLLFLGDRGR